MAPASRCSGLASSISLWLMPSLWRLPPEEGVADIDMYLLWNPERRQTPAEAEFLEHFRHYVARYSLMERLGEVNAPLAALRAPTA